MDPQTLINFAFGIIAAGCGWIIRSIYDAMNALKNDVKEIEREMHNYVLKDDYKDDIREIKDMLGAIWKKLDSKADK